MCRTPWKIAPTLALLVLLLASARAGAQQPDWDKRIAQAQGASWRELFSLGQQLAGADGDAPFEALKKAWPSMSVQFKQQMLKAWHFEEPAPFRVRYHPLAFDVFALALEEKPAGEIAKWAANYVPTYAWQSFATPEDAARWVRDHIGGKPASAGAESMRAWVATVSATTHPSNVAAMMNMLPAIGYPFRRNQWLVEEARKAEMLGALEKAVENPDVTFEAIGYAYELLAELDAQKYPREGAKAFLEKFKDREAKQAGAERAKMLKGLDLRRVDNDQRKQWVLFPPLGQTQPENGWGVLVVMPGGDGSVAFAPFVGETIRAAAGPDYVVIEMIAPPLPADEAARDQAVVWPRRELKDARVDFTIEPVVNAAVDALKKERKIDGNRVWAMGWSSGGPPCYTMALEEHGQFKGALISMSVFHEGEYPTLAAARARSFYLLHSPTDFIPMKQPEGAKAALEKAGARVKLVTYEGGHGWHGDVERMIREGVRWLEAE